VTGRNINDVEQQFQFSGRVDRPSVRAGEETATRDRREAAVRVTSVPEVDSRNRGTTGIDRGAELLVRVLESSRPVTLSELATASGIPKSTASRLVSALERQGLVQQEGERGRLRPGPAILRVAERSMLQRSVVELAGPSLDALAQASGETINLGVPARSGVEHLAQVDSRHFLGAGQWLGRSVDYHCTANGKLFLAFGRARLPTRALPRLTPKTIVDPARLEAEVETVRREGFAIAIDELELGLAAIAAPVRGSGGEVIAALSVSGPTTRMGPDRVAELKPIVIAEAATLSRRLGNEERRLGGDEQGEHAA
jgi:DNA-binding IclR family transcriptional regulator